MSRALSITMSVTTDDPVIAAHVSEQFARTAAGLALDGAASIVSIGPEYAYADEIDE